MTISHAYKAHSSSDPAPMCFLLLPKLVFLAFKIHSLWKDTTAPKGNIFVDLWKIRARRVANHLPVVGGSPGKLGRAGKQHGKAASPFFTPMLVSERQQKVKI